MNDHLEIIEERAISTARKTPLLFVHGVSHGAWCWQEHFLPYFARHNYTSFAINLQGHGKSTSSKKLRSISIADYVSDIEKVIGRLERPPVLIGHSMGGMIVQKYLESHQVPAAVLLSSVPSTGLLKVTFRIAFRHFLIFLKINLTRSLKYLIETPGLCKEMLFSENMPDRLVKKYFTLMQDESYRALLDMIFLNLPHPELVKTPLLVLCGANDAVVSLSEYKKTAKVYGTQAEIFPDRGHDMFLCPGWEAVADRILEWLDEQKL